MNKNLNLVNFIALMGSSALTLATKLFFHSAIINLIVYFSEAVIIILFLYYLFRFISHLSARENFVANLTNPAKANLYSAMPIAAALVSLMLVKIGLPFTSQFDLFLATFFWFISLIFSLIFIILVPINLKFRSNLEQVSGTWFLPPVGLFVLIMAGSALALRLANLAYSITILNLLLLGPAFVLYFLTLSLVYFKSKFYDLHQPKLAPTFNIVLAPVAVSMMGLLFVSQLLGKYHFINFSDLFFSLTKIYSWLMLGYGLWVVAGLLMLYYRVVREKGSLPFSEFWWAFIFPLAAFTLATFNFYQLVSGINFIKILYYLLYFITLFLWLFVLYKTYRSSHLYFPKGKKQP